MELFTVAALVIALFRLGTSIACGSAAEELSAARQKLRQAKLHLLAERKKLDSSALELGQLRAHSILLLEPVLNEHFGSNHQVPKSLTPSWLQKARINAAKCLAALSRANPIPNSAAYACYGALAIEGIQILDRLDGTHDSVLNQTVSDLATQSGVLDSGDSLGLIGDMPLGDILEASLVGFGIIRIAANLSRLSEFESESHRVEHDFTNACRIADELKLAAARIQGASTTMDDATYAVFKYAMLARCAKSVSQSRPLSSLQDRIASAVNTWWMRLNDPVRIS